MLNQEKIFYSTTFSYIYEKTQEVVEQKLFFNPQNSELLSSETVLFKNFNISYLDYFKKNFNV